VAAADADPAGRAAEAGAVTCAESLAMGSGEGGAVRELHATTASNAGMIARSGRHVPSLVSNMGLVLVMSERTHVTASLFNP
jgi:hypothetical protein